MIQTCLFCGNSMQSMRSTKKYCSDNCKQLAFYKRSGLQLSGINVKEPLNDKIIMGKAESIEETNERPIKISNKPYGLSLNDESPSSVSNDFTVKQQLEESTYQWIHSTMVDNIVAYAENDQELSMFHYPEKYWGTYTLPTVKWVSLRLRCLLESLIRLSNIPSIAYADLIAVKEAFNSLIASRHFNNLPDNYPYTQLVKELQLKIVFIAQQFKRQSSIQFRITADRKALLIARRYLLADFVPAIHFKELDFKE